jgi:hypothetical protein
MRNYGPSPTQQISSVNRGDKSLRFSEWVTGLSKHYTHSVRVYHLNPLCRFASRMEMQKRGGLIPKSGEEILVTKLDRVLQGDQVF